MIKILRPPPLFLKEQLKTKLNKQTNKKQTLSIRKKDHTEYQIIAVISVLIHYSMLMLGKTSVTNFVKINRWY